MSLVARPHAAPRALRRVPLLVALLSVRESFWVIPIVMVLAAGGLALGLLQLDGWLGWKAILIPGLEWVQLGGHAAARQLLTALAGAIITVAGVVFSVTTAVLALTTSQFGPRLLRHFVTDRGIQAVLGTFLATFVYTLIVSLALGSGEGPLPRVSVLTAAGLTLASVAVFVYFVHHVATHIQADYVIARAASELAGTIEGVFGGLTEDEPAPEPEPEPPGPPRRVEATGAGYVRSVDVPRLVELARGRDLLLRVDRAPGAFVGEGDPLLQVHGGDGLGDDELDALRSCFYLGVSRTGAQDVEFALEQLVEIGVRALSPGLNDPFTAVRCIDRLGAALCSIARRAPPVRVHRDDEGRPRVVVHWTALPGAIERALSPLVEYGGGHARVVEALIDAIGRVARVTDRPDAREALARQLDALERACAAFSSGVRARLTDRLRDVAIGSADAARTSIPTGRARPCE